MALISCIECHKSINTEAGACPYCGATQSLVEVLPALPVGEEIFYSDKAVIVTNLRIVMGGTTYVLRSITSVRMFSTPPRLIKPILLLVVGLLILLAAFMPLNENAPAPIGVYIIAGAMIAGAILWLCTTKNLYHIGLSSASGEVHALSSKNRAYIERVVLSINKAIIRHQ